MIETRIIINSIICRLCNTEITSNHRWDFNFCKCRSVAVDGDKEYMKRSGDITNWIDTSIIYHNKQLKEAWE